MTGNPLVTIIMTTYNESRFVREALDSVLQQTYNHWELLVADDCSTDNTREILTQFTDPRIRQAHNTEHCHYMRTRNRLFGLARGELVTFLDGDDVMLPERLEKQVAAFMANPYLGLCGCEVEFIDADSRPLDRNKNHPIPYEAILSQLPERSAFSGATIMVRKEILNEMGGYRDFFHGIGSEDYDLTSRIAEKYYSINLPDVLNKYRQHANATSKQNLAQNPFKWHSGRIVQRLIRQRRSGMQDDLNAGRTADLIQYVMELHRPYILDPTRIYRELAGTYLHYGRNADALGAARQAIALQPHRFVNYRTWFYVLRRRWFG